MTFKNNVTNRYEHLRTPRTETVARKKPEETALGPSKSALCTTLTTTIRQCVLYLAKNPETPNSIRGMLNI